MSYLNETQLKEFTETLTKIDYNTLFAEIDAQYERASGEAKLTMEWLLGLIAKYYNNEKNPLEEE